VIECGGLGTTHCRDHIARTKADRDKKPECGRSKVVPSLPTAIVRWLNGNSKFEASCSRRRRQPSPRARFQQHSARTIAYMPPPRCPLCSLFTWHVLVTVTLRLPGALSPAVPARMREASIYRPFVCGVNPSTPSAALRFCRCNQLLKSPPLTRLRCARVTYLKHFTSTKSARCLCFIELI